MTFILGNGKHNANLFLQDELDRFEKQTLGDDYYIPLDQINFEYAESQKSGSTSTYISNRIAKTGKTRTATQTEITDLYNKISRVLGYSDGIKEKYSAQINSATTENGLNTIKTNITAEINADIATLNA